MFNTTWMKWSGVTILVGLLLLFAMSFPLIKEGSIFSNMFVDAFAPKKVFIIERNPIRIMYFGEISNEETEDRNNGGDSDVELGIIKIIEELRKMEAVPAYPLNTHTIIDVDSSLATERGRSLNKQVILQDSTGKAQVIETGDTE